MSETKKVKIQSIIENQIPEFLNEESPLFNEFLKQYYISQEHETGISNIARNLPDYKNVELFNDENFYTDKNPCLLSSDILAFSDIIDVNSTISFPETYGLIKINDEIITYTSKTSTSFNGCIRGFSGISKNSNNNLNFSSTKASDHSVGSFVNNLSLDYYKIIFNKFKSQFLPGFEDRKFTSKAKLKNILLEARDFYTTKGTDVSFKLLFSILFGKNIDVITPVDYTLSPSSNEYIKTKNILVEQIIRSNQTKLLEAKDLQKLKGKNIFQNVFGDSTDKLSSASIYNIEYRPFEKQSLFEISLDFDTFFLNFNPTKKTKNIENVSNGSDQILVDSTVGFEKKGNIIVKTNNLEYPLTISYTDKTINQFLGVTGLIDSISYNSDIIEENFLYTFLDDDTKIEFRLINLIESIDYTQSSNLRIGDKVSLSKFGLDLNDNQYLKQWIYNISGTHEIESISNTGSSTIIKLKNQEVTFIEGEILRLNDTFENTYINVVVLEALTNNFGKVVRIPTLPNPSAYKSLRKEIKKSSSNQNYFPEIISIPSGVQNSYVDYDLNYFYIASTGIPDYTIFSNDSKKYVNIFSENTNVIESQNHGFFTGEKIYYFGKSSSGISTGAYYITRIDQNSIKLSFNTNDLLLNRYLSFNSLNAHQTDYFVKFGFTTESNQIKKLKNQKLFKKFLLNKNIQRTPSNKTLNDKTIGMLLDGVEINSATLYDENMYYGEIDNIIVDNKGSNYDVINFSGLDVLDIDSKGISIGSSCEIHANIIGNIKEVIVISPGVGYQQKPKITLVGGNGQGAILESNLVKTNIISLFKGDISGLNFENDSITFLNNHNFENSEEVIYDSNSNTPILPFINNSKYFVSTINEKTIKIFNSKSDASSGINTINISGISTGIHSFKTLNSKNTITKVYVKFSGSGYSNRLIKISSISSINNKTNGINVYENYIFAKNHGFKNRDIITYQSEYPISGLSTEINYISTIIDNNKFKLSIAGIGTEFTYDNYEKKQYVNISGIGSGYHIFSYPKIEINVESLSAIGSSVASTPILKPIVLGEIQDVFIVSGGKNYGNPNILNFHRRPFIGISSITSQSILSPVIINGKIISVQILNKGKGYKKDITLKIIGNGKYAELEPIINDSKIVDVNVLNSGIGYDSNTKILIEKRGIGAKFVANVFEWKINQIEKNKSIINPIDESIIITSKDEELGLKIINFYPTKKIRYSLKDNILSNNQEIPLDFLNKKSLNILGWAYDGNPIFGPYATFGSDVRRVKSSYRVITTDEKNYLEDSSLRPKNQLFPLGFFTQDYIFDKKNTEGDLDEYNGMYIEDKNLPGIHYGYFFTIDDNSTSSPVFPYVIGKEFKDYPFVENFDPKFNQDYDLSKLNIVRNIGPYYINSIGSKYEIINKVNKKYKQDFIVEQIQSSGISSIKIYKNGDNYKVEDFIQFNNFQSGGNGASVEVSTLLGKNIVSINAGITTFKTVKLVPYANGFKGITTSPNGFFSGQDIIISGISSNKYSNIAGSYKVLTNIKSVSLLENVYPTTITGNWTEIKISDISGFEVDDFIKIDSEILKITNILQESSTVCVNRFSSISTTHYAGISSVILLPNKFLISSDVKINSYENKNYYFNPRNSIGIGSTGSFYNKDLNVLTTNGILIGSNNDTRKYIGISTGGNILIGDLVFGDFIPSTTKVINVGISSVEISTVSTFTGITTEIEISFKRSVYDRFVPPKSIYIPNHPYYTGQELIYTVGIGGTGIYTINNLQTYQLKDKENIYAVNLGIDYIGISTLGFSTISGIGTNLNSVLFTTPNENIGFSHCIKTKYPELTAKVESYFADIVTDTNHGLLTNDKIKLNSIPNFSKIITIRYDSQLNKITTDLINFITSIGVNTLTSEISISDNELHTGDKIVYYNNGNDSIGGLTNNSIYYILKENTDSIKLCPSLYDSNNGKNINFTSVGVGTHSFAQISPKILVINGSNLIFNLDETLFDNTGLLNFDFNLYKDSFFTEHLESFKYKKNNNIISLNTQYYEYQNELYYNLVPIDSSIDASFTILDKDPEVFGSNKIKIIPSSINQSLPIVSTSTTSYRINFKEKIENNNYEINSGIGSIFYETNSKNAFGPISKFKINYKGINYFKLPKIISIASTSGYGALVKCESDTIGKIMKLERIKDGFDYPSDFTLKPYLSIPTVVQIKNISRVDYVKIVSGGSGYTSPPSLKVLGNNNLKLSAKINGGSISEVIIEENANNLSNSLNIVPIRNSNGYEIDYIVVNGTEVTLELINNDTILYPLINVGFANTSIEFPFNVGDEIFIENCRQIKKGQTDEFNSKNYNYQFFKIIFVDKENYSITYDMKPIKNNFIGNLVTGESNYFTDFGYGFVVNKNKMAKFEMILIDDLSYISGEKVYSNKFNAVVMDNGWDNEINQLRLDFSNGELKKNDKLFGEISLLNGTVETVNTFNLKSTIGVSREKINLVGKESGLLNDYQQRISDNNYYQKFSYALKGEIPYTEWKEPILSLIHPSGFKEFSDLDILSKSEKNMKISIGDSNLNLLINIDNEISMQNKRNFTLVSEDSDNFFEGAIERFIIGANEANVSGIGITGPIFGMALKPYTLNKTNKVLDIDDISGQFDGSNSYKIIDERIVFLNSFIPNYIGISTVNLKVGDYIGLSSFIDAEKTFITQIGINSVRINTSHRLNIGSASTIASIKRTLPGNNIVGIQSFKLTSGGIPLFYREFDSSNGITTSIDLNNNLFTISNHHLQSGQKIFYSENSGTKIGIETTSSVEADVDIIMEVGGSGGGSIYENGYNVGISTFISGSSINIVGASSRYYGFGNPIPSYSLSGIGTQAKFEIFITYDPGTGSPLSTSIILKQGGGQYAVGNNIGISGTYLGGTDPANNLTFFVSKLSSSRLVGQSNQSYLNVSSTIISGTGSYATFNVYRNSSGDVNSVQVVNGGIGYTSSSNLKINGSNIGGSNGIDDLFVSPTILGTDKMPNILYVQKNNDSSFKVLGTPSSDEINFTSLGIGTHSFTYDNPNANSLILIDNIIQTPINLKNVLVQLSQSIGIGSTNIYLSVGINSISGLDFLKINNEYLKINSIGVGATNIVEVSRGYFGSSAENHSVGSAVTVVAGDYNIVKDNIYFSNPPYGKIGPKGLEIHSEFTGKLFSRSFDYLNFPKDKNIILDNISIDFTGVAQNIGIRTATLESTNKLRIVGIDTTSLKLADVINLVYSDPFLLKENTIIESIGAGYVEINTNHNVNVGIATTTISIVRLNFVLKSNKENVVGIFSDTNGSGIDINNNPIILINNIPQISGVDYIIDTPGNNTIKFLSGIPNAGRIKTVSISTCFGYAPLISGSSNITVSGFGTISNVSLINFGSGYRVPPSVSILSAVGYGASFATTIGYGGTITSISIINPGIGYTISNKLFKTVGVTTQISIGSTIIFVEETSTVTIGSSVSIVGTSLTNANITSVGQTSVTIGYANTIGTVILNGAFAKFSTYEHPKLIFEKPLQYYQIPLEYAPGFSGSGQFGKCSVIVGNSSSITSFEISNPGMGYKVGEVLTISGIVTSQTLPQNKIRILVTEEMTDKFSGMYPGQFVKLDNISNLFNGKRKRFTISLTRFGESSPLSLKIDPGVSLNLQNNLFVYLNDILQKPFESFTFSGSRITFVEAPKENSKCTIMFYRGSSLDVEDIIPIETIKEGDKIQINENKNDPYDIPQFERVVKKIIASDQVDTLPYDSIGINLNPFAARPLDWKIQTEDIIINGVFYSKSRKNLKSKNIPSSKIIKSIKKQDTQIYVSNAFPIFSLDEKLGIDEDLRNVIIVDNKKIEDPSFISIVSTGSSISEIQILNGGKGYSNNLIPSIKISSSFITKKDPILNWKSTVGINSNLHTFNSVIYGDKLIAVGSEGKYGLSDDGINWELRYTGYNSELNSIVYLGDSRYIGVGYSGTLIEKIGIANTLTNWNNFKLTKKTTIFGFSQEIPSQYNGKFKSITYSKQKESIVAVGEYSPSIGYCPIFSAIGVGFTQFLERATTNTYSLFAVTNNNEYFVTVGNNSAIRYSNDAISWTIVGDFNKPAGMTKLNDVIWDGNKFVAVGDNGFVITATNPSLWENQNSNLSENIIKIKYYDDVYVGISSTGLMYYSLNLNDWYLRSTLQSNQIKDIVFVPSIGNNGRNILVGSASTIIYAEPAFNRAVAITTTSNSSISSVIILNGGFGYSQNQNPPVIAETDYFNYEELKSIKTIGDFGIISGINTSGAGSSTIKFSLKSENYDNFSLGIGYSSLNSFNVLNSQLSIGDRFIIFDSNIGASTQITGITTYNGFSEVVGVITSFLDGIYSVEEVSIPDQITGIVTVTCRFSSNPSIFVGANTTSFYGRYSWGKIFGYQNRARKKPKEFEAYVNNGIVGLSSSPNVFRTRPLI